MTSSSIMRGILAEIRAEERKVSEELARRIASGPPEGSGISAEAWRSWLRYGFIVCPGGARDVTCTDKACVCGTRCARMAAKGLTGDGAELPRKSRPACGAKTRAGGTCVMRIEPGKHRCRLHGGLSTGPKTAEGRARIVEAQRRRWGRAMKGAEAGH